MPRWNDSGNRRKDVGGGSGGDRRKGDDNILRRAAKEVKDLVTDERVKRLLKRESKLREKLRDLEPFARSHQNDERNVINIWISEGYGMDVREARENATRQRLEIAHEWVQVANPDGYPHFLNEVRSGTMNEVQMLNRAEEYIRPTDPVASGRFRDLIAETYRAEEATIANRQEGRRLLGEQQLAAIGTKYIGDSIASTQDWARYFNERGSSIFDIESKERILSQYENSTDQRYQAWGVLRDAQYNARYNYDNPPPPPAYGQ